MNLQKFNIIVIMNLFLGIRIVLNNHVWIVYAELTKAVFLKLIMHFHQCHLSQLSLPEFAHGKVHMKQLTDELKESTAMEQYIAKNGF